MLARILPTLKPIASAALPGGLAAAPGRESADPRQRAGAAKSGTEIASVPARGERGRGARGARGSSALKAKPPACCYLLNNRGADSQPERNVILVSQPGKTSELPAAAIATAGKEPSSPLLCAAQRGQGGWRSLPVPLRLVPALGARAPGSEDDVSCSRHPARQSSRAEPAFPRR